MSPPSACMSFSLFPSTLNKNSISQIMVPKKEDPTKWQRPLLLATISERVQELVLYPGSLTEMVLPLIPVARTQWAPPWTFKITMLFLASSPAMLPLETLPTYDNPRELTAPQTKRSPLTYPPCPLSQVLRDEGLQPFPHPARAMETELMRHPALQMVLDEVPSCSLPHLASHCLQVGQDLLETRIKMTASTKYLIAIVLNNRLFITEDNIHKQ